MSECYSLLCTADGSGEQDDYEIYQGLFQITDSLKQLREGRSHYSPSFPPQTALTKTFEEQIEEEGGNEAVDSQLVNKRIGNNILDEADKTKGYILNFYIDRINHKPWWYYRI
ncbi:MAG: hypothetical protein EZS28_009636 [Streblomastix strix]|uniref:Uncharacterized protein n=1 Tax=Streblomastix strix TaxID=222440 RepID=A0A5J4WIL8_9EUKA|nr:MAG: hypothetical protein EZS28_009636 [Streblomastix strix]